MELTAFLMQVRFDYTITLGNLVSAVAFLALAGAAWTDLRWRIKNLETWRTEHMVDADARDQLITNIDKILYHVTRGKEGSK